MSARDATSSRRTPASRRVRTSMPYALLAIMCAALFVFPQFAGRRASAFNIYDALQLWSAYGLVALGVGLTMIVGEFDFGVLGVFALCPMIAVKLGEINLFLGLGAALALAAVVGFLQGAIVAKLRVHSMPVTLGFYIALLGREPRDRQFPKRVVLESRRGFRARRQSSPSFRRAASSPWPSSRSSSSSCDLLASAGTSARLEETGGQAAWWASRSTGC